MRTFKKVTMISAAIVIAVSMGSVAVASEEGDKTRTRAQAQEPVGEMSKAQKGVQNQYRHNYRNNYQKKTPSMGSGSMSRQSNGSRSTGSGRR